MSQLEQTSLYVYNRRHLIRHLRSGIMEYRSLGSTQLQVSSLAFGAGPVPAVMTSNNHAQQLELIAHAIDSGINWFDTAATYGGGTSEKHLGRALAELHATERVHVASKVRLKEEDLTSIRDAVRRSVDESLARLQLTQLTLLQLHNSVTQQRGDLATSLTVSDVLKTGGVLEAMEKLREEGVVRWLGFTGLGHAACLHRLVDSGRFQTVQIPFSLVNPTASRPPPSVFSEDDLGQIIPKCAARGMGVFAIRVYAGGALAQLPPSEHTRKTPFFPLALYNRDLARARCMEVELTSATSVPEAALRFALGEPGVSAAIVGFSEPNQITRAISWSRQGLLDEQLVQRLLHCSYRPTTTETTT